MKYTKISAIIFLAVYLTAQSGLISSVIGYFMTVCLLILSCINLILAVIWFIITDESKQIIKDWFIQELDKDNENF